MLLKIFKLIFLFLIFLQVNIAFADASGQYLILTDVNVFIKPEPKSRIVSELNTGSKVHVVGVSQNKQWFKISLQDNQYGFVHKGFLKKVSAKKSKTPNQFDSFFGGNKPQESAVSAGTQPKTKSNYDDFFSKAVVDGQVAELEREYEEKEKAEQLQASRIKERAKEKVKEKENEIARCDKRHRRILDDIKDLGELFNEHQCMASYGSKTIYSLLDNMKNNSKSYSWAEYCLNGDEELKNKNSEMATDIAESISNTDCKGSNSINYLRDMLSNINSSNKSSFIMIEEAMENARRGREYNRRENAAAQKQRSKWLNNLGKTAQMYKKQNEQMMRDTATAFKKSNAIRQKQEKIARQDNARKQEEYQNQLQKQQDALRERERIAAKKQDEYRNQLQKQQDALKNREHIVTKKSNRYENTPSSSNVRNTTSNNQTNSKAKQKSPSKNEIEALAYCWQTKSKKGWYCDGIIQKITISEKTIEKALDLVGCDSYRKKVVFDKGWIYFCTDKMLDLDMPTKKMTWNRDISQWRTIPQSILNQRLRP